MENNSLKEIEKILADAAKNIEECASKHSNAMSITHKGMEKLRLERELLRKDKARFAELSKRIEDTHFSKVSIIHLNSDSQY
jgi:hypothetical protein